MDCDKFKHLQYCDKSYRILHNEMLLIPYTYRKEVLSLMKTVFLDLERVFKNEVLYSAFEECDALYVKRFWGTDGGLLIDLSLSPDSLFEACTLYVDEVRHEL